MRLAFQYVDRATPIHRLHPLVKILYLLLTLLIVIAPYDPTVRDLSTVAIWVLLGVTLWILARLGVRSFSFLIKFLTAIFVFLLVTQGLLYQGDGPVLIRFGHLQFWGSDIGTVTVEGLFFGLVLCLRILAATLALPLLVSTTSTSQLLAALHTLRVPPRLAFMFVSALSFTHLVIQMWESILDAQKLRGFDIEAMSIWQRARKAYVPVLTPLILLLFRKGNDLQIALESKGFGSPHKATQIEILPFTARDAAAALAIAAVFALAFGVKFGWIAGGV